jgi:S1-C subfamily serine protease
MNTTLAALGAVVVSTCSCFAQSELSQLVERVRPAVVTIETFSKSGTPIGQGSGFFIDGETVITNAHVIKDADHAQVVRADGIKCDVSGVIADNGHDDVVYLSVLCSQRPGATLQWGRDPKIGERVFVLGSPKGLDNSLSDGLSSGVRDIDGIGRVLQVTAPISHGSSGSPVMNMKGEVVGVAAATRVDAQNINFAVPASIASGLVRSPSKPLLEVKSPHAQSPKSLVDLPDDESIWSETTAASKKLICERAADFMKLPNGVYLDGYRTHRIMKVVTGEAGRTEEAEALGINGMANVSNPPAMFEIANKKPVQLKGWILIAPIGGDQRSLLVQQVLSENEVLASAPASHDWIHVTGPFLQKASQHAELAGVFFLEPVGKFTYMPELGARREVPSFKAIYPDAYELTAAQLAQAIKRGDVKLQRYHYSAQKGDRRYRVGSQGSNVPDGYDPAYYRWEKTPITVSFTSLTKNTAKSTDEKAPESK